MELRQEAVVPHNLVVFSISFRSFSGLPATMNGHVCGGNTGRQNLKKRKKIQHVQAGTMTLVL